MKTNQLLVVCQNVDETIEALLIGSIPKNQRFKEIERISKSLKRAIAKATEAK